MNVAIILFSPTGNTLQAGKMLEHSLSERGIGVQFIDMARNTALKARTIARYLKEKVQEHDLLCIGGPVYAHHLHYTVQEIIKSLPQPENGWSGLAVPFITYGGVHSGVALKDAADLLKKSGRTVVAGMKLNASHCLTQLPRISVKINEGMPGDEAIPVIEELADRIMKCDGIKDDEAVDVSEFLNYQSLTVRIKASLIFRERFWHRRIYPKVVYDYDACKQCGKCAKMCPVQRIEMHKKGPESPAGTPECIHCGACITACPFSAIDFDVDWGKWEKLLSKAAKGEGPLVSNEFPKSQVY